MAIEGVGGANAVVFAGAEAALPDSSFGTVVIVGSAALVHPVISNHSTPSIAHRELPRTLPSLGSIKRGRRWGRWECWQVAAPSTGRDHGAELTRAWCRPPGFDSDIALLLHEFGHYSRVTGKGCDRGLDLDRGGGGLAGRLCRVGGPPAVPRPPGIT